jgi:hypothetical protein
MLKQVLSIACGCMLLTSSAWSQISQTRLNQLDSLVGKTPKPNTKKTATLGAYLGSLGKTEEEKAYAIYSWVAHNVKYDLKVFVKDYVPKFGAEEVLKGRITVCQGYSEIYNALSQAARLESKLIDGFSKGFNYYDGMKFREPDHAWNAVKYNESWHLLDCTWGAGKIVNSELGAQYTPEFNRNWFNTPPHLFALSHYPSETEWTLLQKNASLSEYQKWPAADIQFLLQLKDSEALVNSLLEGQTVELPTIYTHKHQVIYESIPLQSELSKSQQYTFTISSESNLKFELMDGKEFIPFKASNGSSSLTYTPKTKKLVVVVVTPKSKDYLIEYKVSK